MNTDYMLQQARIARAYLDAHKSFELEQDLAFCPLMTNSNGLNTSSPSSSATTLSKAQQLRASGNIDSASIFRILAAAAAVNQDTTKQAPKKFDGKSRNYGTRYYG